MIKEVGLVIPDSAVALINSGALVRTNGILRNADTMSIVKHLKIVDLGDKTCWQELGTAIGRVVKEHKTGVIVAAGVVVAVVGTVGVVIHRKHKKRKELEEKCNAWLNREIKNYIDSARDGKLDVDTITAFEETLMNIPRLTDKIFVSMTKEQILEFTDCLRDYTYKLAEANNKTIVDSSQLEYQENVIMFMLNILNAQKEILKKCA